MEETQFGFAHLCGAKIYDDELGPGHYIRATYFTTSTQEFQVALTFFCEERGIRMFEGLWQLLQVARLYHLREYLYKQLGPEHIASVPTRRDWHEALRLTHLRGTFYRDIYEVSRLTHGMW